MRHEQAALDLKVELELEYLGRYQLLLAPLYLNLLQSQCVQEYVHRVLLYFLMGIPGLNIVGIVLIITVIIGVLVDETVYQY